MNLGAAIGSLGMEKCFLRAVFPGKAANCLTVTLLAVVFAVFAYPADLVSAQNIEGQADSTVGETVVDSESGA